MRVDNNEMTDNIYYSSMIFSLILAVNVILRLGVVA
jgi:hypothetical protein